MSSFFGRLAARIRQTSGAVRPRLPLLFESTPSVARGRDAFGEPETVYEDSGDSASVAVRRPRRTTQSPPPVPSSFAQPSVEVSPLSTGAPARLRQSSFDQTVPTRPHEVSPSVSAQIERAPQDASGAVVVAKQVHTDPREALSERNRAEPVRRPSPEIRVASNVRTQLDGTGPGGAQPLPAPESAKTLTVIERSTVVRNVAVAAPSQAVPRMTRAVPEPPPAIVPRVAAKPVVPERVIASAGETTVHVSIGRIEVRAMPRPSERRRVPAASAVMSLDDYLRSHAEGRRR